MRTCSKGIVKVFLFVGENSKKQGFWLASPGERHTFFSSLVPYNGGGQFDRVGLHKKVMHGRRFVRFLFGFLWGCGR